MLLCSLKGCCVHVVPTYRSMSYSPSSSHHQASNSTVIPLPQYHNIGLIIGLSIGGVFLGLVLIGVVILFLRRRRSDSGGSFSYASSLYGDSEGSANLNQWDGDSSDSSCCRRIACCCFEQRDSREGRFISSVSSGYLEI